MLALGNVLTGFALARQGLDMASPFAAAAAPQPSCTNAEVSPSAILLPSNWKAETGAALWEGTVLGKQLGAGVQARVFELVTSEGRPTGKVLKIGHGDIGHKLLNNPIIWIGMEREWEIGMQLRAALEHPDGSLPGFMRVCDCVVSSAGGGVRFAGMILEKLNGWEIYKRVDQPEFCNISYIRECLYQVFSALDRAQRKTGLHHADLGMRNIMENYPLLYEEPQADITQQQREALAGVAPVLKPPQVSANRYEASVGALPDDAPHRVVTVTGDSVGGLIRQLSGAMEAAHPASPTDGEPTPRQSMGMARHSGVPGGHCHHVRPRVGFSCNKDGSRMPLGPHIEFKIIDYGVAVFDEDLAQASGGYESRETLSRIRHLFASKRVTFKPEDPNKDGRVSMATSDSNMPGRKKQWHLVPTGVSNRFRVKHTPSGAAPLRSAESEAAAPQRLQSALGATASRDLGEPNPDAKGDGKPPTPAMSPIERLYRRFWNRKGDVFHLLLSLAITLDDRVWPAKDKPEVQLFISLVHHVTGVEMKASFAHVGELEGQSMLGRLLRVTSGHHRHDEHREAKVKAWGRRGKWHHFFRRIHIRAKAHFRPFNSGLLAGEALVSPFFGEGRVQYATLPVCVEAAFPDH